jgi:hypothetical protein
MERPPHPCAEPDTLAGADVHRHTPRVGRLRQIQPPHLVPCRRQRARDRSRNRPHSMDGEKAVRCQRGHVGYRTKDQINYWANRSVLPFLSFLMVFVSNQMVAPLGGVGSACREPYPEQ